MVQADWAGDERCNLLEDIETEIQNFESIPSDQRQILLWAIDYLLKYYRCRP